jgi:predicted MFS family arabinose efflux permease
MLHLGVVLVAAGTVVLALSVAGKHSATTWSLAPGLFVIGLGAGFAFGQLFDFILAGVAMEEVGSASGVLNAVQQLASALGVAVLGTVFFSESAPTHLPTDGLSVAAWVCLAPLALAALLVFRLPREARQEQ